MELEDQPQIERDVTSHFPSLTSPAMDAPITDDMGYNVDYGSSPARDEVTQPERQQHSSIVGRTTSDRDQTIPIPRNETGAVLTPNGC